MFRSFSDKDYVVVHEWWNWWWGKDKGIEKNILPEDDYCYMIEKNNKALSLCLLFVKA